MRAAHYNNAFTTQIPNGGDLQKLTVVVFSHVQSGKLQELHRGAFRWVLAIIQDGFVPTL